MINTAFAALLHELAAEIPDVLRESFTFAGLWADLCRIAGEPRANASYSLALAVARRTAR